MKNLKRIFSIAIALIMIFAFAACSNNTPAPAPAPAPAAPAPAAPAPAGPAASASGFEGAPTFDLKIAHPHPAGSGTDVGYTRFAELMEEYTEGTVKATVFPAGSLITTAEGVDALRNGTVEICQISSGDVATVIPALNLIEIPGSYSQRNTDYVEGIAPVMRETMAPYGIHFLYPQPGTPSWFFSNIDIVKSPADMAGKKVRASGQYGGKAIEIWGGSPVTITLADLTTAMERNTVDIIITPGLGAYSNGWYELEHYISVADISTLMAMMAMSEDTFQKMTPAQQDAVHRAALEGAMAMYEATMKDVEEGFIVMGDYGNEIYTLTDAENLVFKQALDPLRQQVLDDVGAEAENLEAVLKQFR